MAATILEETGHRGETEYEFELLEQYFEVSEMAIKEAEQSETKRLQEELAHVEEEMETACAAGQFLEQAVKFVREFLLRLRYGS